jgi:hypothetical protein
MNAKKVSSKKEVGVVISWWVWPLMGACVQVYLLIKWLKYHGLVSKLEATYGA